MTSRAWIGVFAIVSGSACEVHTGAAASCDGTWAAATPEAAPPLPSARTVAQILPTESAAIDILFVIDDSRSMTDEQAQLGLWSRELFDLLSGSGELPDLHLAVTSSSVPIPELEQCKTGTGGTFHVGAAPLRGPRFLRDVAGSAGRERNYVGTLTETFAEMARVGDTGCGFEQPFKAARTVLTRGDSFLRDEALLLVVFVTDEDDCSARDSTLFLDPYADGCSELGTFSSYRCFEHGVRCHDGKGSRELGERKDCRPDEASPYVESVSAFAEFLKDLKPNPSQVVVAAIYGKPHPVVAVRDERIVSRIAPRLAGVCSSGGKEGTGAAPAVRMNALMAEFGGRASHSSICEPELAWAMRDVGLVTRGAAARSPCLRGGLRDTDAIAPGIQPRCRVEAIRHDVRGPKSTGIEVPLCERAERARCFTVEVDAGCAETASQLAVRVLEPGLGETLTVDCEIE